MAATDSIGRYWETDQHRQRVVPDAFEIMHERLINKSPHPRRGD